MTIRTSRPLRSCASVALALLALAAGSPLHAQPAGIQLRETSGNTTRFVVAVPAPKLDPLAWAADVRSIAVTGFESAGMPGETALPMRMILVAVPATGEVSIETRASTITPYDGILLATQPVIRSRAVSDPTADEGVRRSMLGNRERRPGPTSEEPWARIESISWMRDQRVARILVQPARYDLGARRVSVAGEIEISVHSTGGPTPARATRSDRGGPDPFEVVYLGALVNAEQGRAWRWRSPSGTAPAAVEGGPVTVVPDTSIYAGRDWVKLAVAQPGVYKVSYAQVRGSRLFANRTNIPLDSLRLYTWPGYPLLPEGNYCDSCDYREVAIQVVADTGAAFNNNDYIYFYGLGPSDWGNVYDPSRPDTEFVNSPYELQNYYFLTFGETGRPVGGTPKRITVRSGAIGDPTGTTTPVTIAARAHFEQDNEYEVDAAPTNNPLNPQDARFDVSSTRRTIFWEKWFWKSVLQGNEARTDPVDIPGIDASQPIRLRARWWGLNRHDFRSVNISDHYVLGELNGVPVINRRWNLLLPQTVDTVMMAPVTSGFQMRTVVPRVTDPRPDYDAQRNDRVGFAWFDIFYQRRFTPVNDAFDFQTTGGGSFVYSIGPFRAPGDSIPRVFEVTDPLAPVEVVNIEYTGAGTSWQLRFRSDETTPRRYRVIPEHDIKQMVPNAITNAAASSATNLRSTTRKADYLLIYFDEFGAAAQDLLTWRQQHLPLVGNAPFDTASVPISAIYDQFSGGRLDPTAIRNFLRAVYYNWRAGGHDQPLYVCLLGDASSDFKNITGNVPAGTTGTFVPSYEGGWDPVVSRQFGSDDWLLNADNPNLTIPEFLGGRIPARDAGAAISYVRDKLIPYESTVPVGTWRNTVMLIADDNMQGSAPDRLSWEHVRQTAALDEEGTPQHIDRDYVYLHTYPTTAQFTKAGARTDIVNGINEGRIMVNYIGHGSPFQISDERVYVPGDADNQTNATRPCVFVAASCDVGKFNDPLDSSIGEKLVLNPVGGAVGVISATELAFSNQNADLNMTLYHEIFRRDSLTGRYFQPLAAGLLRAKLVGSTNNQKYQVMGDAATRLVLPAHTVELTFVDANDQPDTVASRGNPLKFRGRILDRPGGNLVPLDGELDLLIEDSSPIDQTSGGTAYRFTASPMFRGNVQVTGGVFAGQCVVPVDAHAGDLGRGRGYLLPASQGYADDAVGSHGLLVQAGTPPPGDDAGPAISLSFRGGSTTVLPDAALRIDIADPSGVLISGNAPQNGIIVTVDGSSTQRYDVTPSFRYATNSYQAGTASFTLPNLSPGAHTISVSAADNLAGGIAAAQHRSIATISFSVSDNPALNVTRAILFPNPILSGGAAGGGTFVIDVPGGEVNVLLRIYTVNGKLIRELTSFGGLGQVQIPWDGLDAEGDRLANGTYLFRVHVNPQDPDGTSSPRQKATAEGRLVVIGH
jgi:hypothetical protein